MKHQKTTIYYFFALLFLSNALISQTTKQEKMKQLNFMVGEWIGTSKIYEKGIISKEGTAYQEINYDLNKNILVIKLNSDFLQLHTIIYYDEKDQKYYYHPFSKNGTRKYDAEYKDGQFIVWSNQNNRFVFSRTSANSFQEYGERLIDGKWIKYFEDNFKNTQ